MPKQLTDVFVLYLNFSRDNQLRYVFSGEWFQEEASTIRNFIISFFPVDNTIEIFDQKSKKLFLKRTRINNLNESDFYIGARVDVFGRQIEITDYGNTFTRDKLAPSREKAFLLLRSNAVENMGRIIQYLNRNNFFINNARMVKFNAIAVRELFSDGSESEMQMLSLLRSLEDEPSVGFELISDNAIKKLYNCIENNEVNKAERLEELCTLFQEDGIKNFVYCHKDPEVVKKQLKYFFNYKSPLLTTYRLKNSILAIIKPHAIKEGKTGPIISDIYNNGFKISALKMILIEKVNCQEFYEVYRGVVPEYTDMVVQLASGVCMAMEIIAKNDTKDIYKEFREFCGPVDPEIAKVLRPNTLRAKYGDNKIQNAIHCTDLPEDINLELEYLFKILQN